MPRSERRSEEAMMDARGSFSHICIHSPSSPLSLSSLGPLSRQGKQTQSTVRKRKHSVLRKRKAFLLSLTWRDK